MKKSIQVFSGFVIGGIFLWLSLRNVDLTELLGQIRAIGYWWIFPYIIVTVFSHWCRAERWKMLLEVNRESKISRRNLLSGLFLGYLGNLAIPRAGEIMRSVYVQRRENMDLTRVIGTVVVERIIDLLVLLLLVGLMIFFIFTDRDTTIAIFGNDGTEILYGIFTWQVGMLLLALVPAFFYLFRVIYRRYIKFYETHDGSLTGRFRHLVRGLALGVLAVRELKNWPMFLLWTFFMWGAYVVMTYIPFWAFDFAQEKGFGMVQAFTITIVSAFGVSLPSPGGIGTYHYFVKQVMVILYGVSLTDALSYAFVSHTVNMLVIVILTPFLLVYNSRRQKKININ